MEYVWKRTQTVIFAVLERLVGRLPKTVNFAWNIYIYTLSLEKPNQAFVTYSLLINWFQLSEA